MTEDVGWASANAASQKHVATCGPARYHALMPVLTAVHIRLDERGVAWVDDTNTKVIEVALDRVAHGWSPEEIHFQHPHLSLGQIHAALGYYYDHQAEMDEQIQRSVEEAQRRRSQAGESPLRKRLRELGKLA